MQLGGATWCDVAATERAGLLVIPVGSLEQHGPHLPLDTDTQIAVELATRLADTRADVMVAPAVAYGASGEHADFPGTLLINHAVLADLLVELVRSARASFAAIVVLSAHGGNREGLALLDQRCQADGDPVLVWMRTPAEPRPRSCWPSILRPCDWTWPLPAPPSRSRCSYPGYAPKVCGRYRPTACWETLKERAPPRESRCSLP
jgi:hypothetical protein